MVPKESVGNTIVYVGKATQCPEFRKSHAASLPQAMRWRLFLVNSSMNCFTSSAVTTTSPPALPPAAALLDRKDLCGTGEWG